MAVLKSTAHLVLDQTNSKLAGSVLQILNDVVEAKKDDRINDAILDSIRCMQYLDRLIYIVPDSAYEHRYGADAIQARRFYNIGAGELWYHPFWTAIDACLIDPNAGIEHILSEHTPLPVADNSAKIIYSSHCLEHLNQKTAEHVLAEAFRILEPGGLIRLAVPDIDIYYRAYQRQENDFFININDNSGQYGDLSLQQNFLAQFIYPCCSLSEESLQFHISDQEVRELFDQLSYEEALDACVKKFPSDFKLKDYPHINWFNAHKLSGLLEEIGFENITRSAYGQSEEMVLCDIACFDYTAPEISLYIEARKPGNG